MDNWHELIDEFLSEAYSLLENLENSLLDLEKNLHDKNSIDTVFRVAHTIKGGAGAVGFDNLTRLTHIMEDVLDLVRGQKYMFSGEDISLLLEVKDELEEILKSHEHNNPRSSDTTDKLIQELTAIKLKALKSGDNTPVSNKNNTLIDKLPMAARFALDLSLIDSLQGALEYDEKLLFIEIRFNEEYELKEVGPFEILNIISSISDPIIMNPSIELMDKEYYPYLNVVIPSDQDITYIQNKLSLPDVTNSITINLLTQELLDEFKKLYSEETTNETNIKVINSNPKTEESKTPLSDTNQEITEHKDEKRNPTLKIESSKIDDILNLLGELVITRSGLTQFGDELDSSLQKIRYSLRHYLSSSQLLPLHSSEDLNIQWNKQFREGLENINQQIEQFMDYSQQLTRISGTLHSEMMHLRMVPIQMVFSRFTRLIRELSRQLNKKIELVIEGGETEIDKGFVDDLYDPLMHMIRNSLDHGIELPEERISNGKSEVGTIILFAYQEGDSIIIKIKDDGKGIDAEKIAQKALEKGFINEARLKNMSQEEKLSLIFLPGFSTAKQVSNLSGRGVGMDVVMRTIQDMGGGVSITSQINEGSTIQIQLPLTLAIIKGLMILIKKVYYIIPLVSIEETIILNPNLVHRLQHYDALEFRDKLIPLIRLEDLLYHTGSKVHTNTIEFCIIVRYGNRQIGIVVPEVLREQDIVVKPLDKSLIDSPGISAATIIRNGDLGFILDIPQVVRYFLKQKK